MSDLRDKRGDAYDREQEGNPQPPQVRENLTPHEQAQGGADVRPEPVPGPEELPKGCGATARDRWARTSDDPTIRFEDIRLTLNYRASQNSFPANPPPNHQGAAHLKQLRRAYVSYGSAYCR